MEIKRYKPKFDKLYAYIIAATAVVVLISLLLTVADHSVGGGIVTGATALFIGYFLVSPCFGYVELRKSAVFIKFGFILKREIPYDRIRGVEKKRTAIADSMLSLKNAMEHVNIKYNNFDLYSVSVADNDGLMEEIKKRCGMQ